jgi:hypothetical protein
MLPALIIAGVGAAMGAINSAKENKRQRAELAAAENRNRMNYYEDVGLLNASKDWTLRKVREQNEKMNRGINSSAVSTGMTHENRLAAMQNAGNIYADAANTATAQQAEKQLASKHHSEARQDAFDQQRQALSNARSQMWANLGSNLASSVIDLGVANSWLGGKKGAEAGGTQGKFDLEGISVPNKFMNSKVDIPNYGRLVK